MWYFVQYKHAFDYIKVDPDENAKTNLSILENNSRM